MRSIGDCRLTTVDYTDCRVVTVDWNAILSAVRPYVVSCDGYRCCAGVRRLPDERVFVGTRSRWPAVPKANILESRTIFHPRSHMGNIWLHVIRCSTPDN